MFSVSAKIWGLTIIPETLVFLHAGTPEMVMIVSRGRWMTHAHVQGVTFVLDSVLVSKGERIEDVTTSESNASSGSESFWSTTTVSRGLQHSS